MFQNNDVYCAFNQHLFNYFKFFRYGIRVDPLQWFNVLTGQDEGAGFPSVILLICK